MNIFILKTMRYLDNPELLTKEEMKKDATAAYADDVDYDVYTADNAGAANYAAYAAVYAVAYAVSGAVDSELWIDKYFKITKENKQNYINEVERLR